LNGQYPKGITTGDIRDRMLDKMCDASRLVDRLESQGLVMKKKNPNDRRLVAVVISESGRDLLSRIAGQHEIFEDLFKNLTTEEAMHLSDLLDKMRNIKSPATRLN
jgi:DNA-binding MarR family transcriptional regulator